MSLADAVRAFQTNPAGLRPPPLPPTPAVAKAARALAKQPRFDAMAEVEEIDRAALLARLLDAKARGGWSGLTSKDLRLAPRVFWDRLPDGGTLAGDAAWLAAYLEQVDQARGRSALRALAREYLRRFEPGFPGAAAVARALLLRRAALVPPWSEAGVAARLFDPDSGGRALGRALLDDPEGPLPALDRHGLGGPWSGAGIAAAAFAAALTVAGERLARSADGTALLDRVLPWATAGGGKLRHPRRAAALAEALLLPWVDREPEPALRQRVEGFLLEHLRDPRLFHQVWQGVDEAAKAVILRWLAKASIEAFLRVFDKHAKSHQWRYRRAFWTAYTDRGYVRNARVVFARALAAEAQELARQTKDTALGHFARLRQPPKPDHAVLLLEIGDLVVADWSHDGPLRIWCRRDPAAPRLDRGEYGPEDLRHSPKLKSPDDYFETRHWPQGSWQQNTHDFIARHTRIHLSFDDYMPLA